MKKGFAAVLGIILVAGLAGGQSDEVLKLKEQILSIQNRGELGFRNFAACSAVRGFGSYTPLAKAVVGADRKLLIYYEPQNVFSAKREGGYEIWYTQDVALLDAQGVLLQEWKDLLEFHYASRAPVLDLFATNDLNLQGLPEGTYKFRAVLKDKLRVRQAVQTIDLIVR
jgi:hypothetical protein